MKSKLEAEMGLGKGFMKFLDEVEQVVRKKDDADYERLDREFDSESDSDQSGFEEDHHMEIEEQEGENEGENVED
jgi:hypothetical protein